MDPFGEIDAKLETEQFKKKRDAFLALLAKPKTEAVRAQIGEARKDLFLDAIYRFKEYYELMAMPGRTDAQDAALADTTARFGPIAEAYWSGKLKAMLTPVALAVSSDVARIQKYGIATREDAFALAKGKGRSRRRRLTRRRRTTRKRS
jgi:hypothetical protein